MPCPQLTTCLRVLYRGLLPFVFAYTTSAQQGKEGGEIFTLPPFNITVYTADIPVVDGFTGREFDGDNETVWEFAQSFNKLLLGYHKKLVIEEVEHMKYRVSLRAKYQEELESLFESFGYNGFEIRKSTLMTREMSIVRRLVEKPFFKVDKLIVWDLEQLEDYTPDKPTSKYGKDIHYNPEKQQWERRVTTQWNVSFFRNQKMNSQFRTDKQQGLNLDTLEGYHFIDYGLPAVIPPFAFKEVKLTYPMFYSANELALDEQALSYLQQTFVANLYYIYDPFSWVARRSTRFRGGFKQDTHEFVSEQRIYVKNRKWFNDTFAQLISDVAIIKFEGLGEIFALQMQSQRIWNSPRALGAGLDLLNWNKGEKRKAKNEPTPDTLWLGGFRHVMITAYLQYRDTFLDRIRERLAEQKELRKKVDGEQMLKTIIEELSGKDYKTFAQNAEKRLQKTFDMMLKQQN